MGTHAPAPVGHCHLICRACVMARCRPVPGQPRSPNSAACADVAGMHSAMTPTIPRCASPSFPSSIARARRLTGFGSRPGWSDIAGGALELPDSQSVPGPSGLCVGHFNPCGFLSLLSDATPDRALTPAPAAAPSRAAACSPMAARGTPHCWCGTNLSGKRVASGNGGRWPRESGRAARTGRARSSTSAFFGEQAREWR